VIIFYRVWVSVAFSSLVSWGSVESWRGGISWPARGERRHQEKTEASQKGAPVSELKLCSRELCLFSAHSLLCLLNSQVFHVKRKSEYFSSGNGQNYYTKCWLDSILRGTVLDTYTKYYDNVSQM
jgi:hypothetical protein